MMRFDVPLFFHLLCAQQAETGSGRPQGFVSLRQDKNFLEVNSNSLPLLKDK